MDLKMVTLNCLTLVELKKLAYLKKKKSVPLTTHQPAPSRVS